MILHDVELGELSESWVEYPWTACFPTFNIIRAGRVGDHEEMCDVDLPTQSEDDQSSQGVEDFLRGQILLPEVDEILMRVRLVWLR